MDIPTLTHLPVGLRKVRLATCFGEICSDSHTVFAFFAGQETHLTMHVVTDKYCSICRKSKWYFGIAS